MIRRLLQPNLHRRSVAVAVLGGFVVGGFPAARGGVPAPAPAIAHNYNFSTPATAAPPLSGQCLVADDEPNKFALHRTDADGNNLEAQLFNVRPGDVFHVDTAQYLVVGIPLIATPVWTFPVIPGGTPPADGLYPVTVTRPTSEIAIPSTTLFGVRVDNYAAGFVRAYWNPAQHTEDLYDGAFHNMKFALAMEPTLGPNGAVIADTAALRLMANPVWWDNNGTIGKVYLRQDNQGDPVEMTVAQMADAIDAGAHLVVIPSGQDLHIVRIA